MHVNVAIVGLDRIGTSFGLALKRYAQQSGSNHTFTIIGSDHNGEAMKTAKKLDAVDNFHRQLLKATNNADLILMNAPLGLVEDHYSRLGPELKPGAVVLDLSPLKQLAHQWAAAHIRTNEQGRPVAYMLGITPVVQVNGLYEADHSAAAARADLFDEASVLITPDAGTPPEVIALAEDVIRLVGGQPHFVDMAEHDGLIAATEGLPSLLGAALFRMLSRSDGWLELRRMVNPNLALALQNLRHQKPDDLLTLTLENRDNQVRHLNALIGALVEVRDALLAEEGPEEMEAFLEAVYRAWDEWDVKRHSGKWEEAAASSERLPGPFGGMGGLFSMGRRQNRDDADD